MDVRRIIEPGDMVLWREPDKFLGALRRGRALRVYGDDALVRFANRDVVLPLGSIERMPPFDEVFGDKPEDVMEDDWYVGPVDEGLPLSEWLDG